MSGVRGKYVKNYPEWIDAPADDIDRYTQVLNSWTPPCESSPGRPWLPGDAKRPEPRPAPAFDVTPDASIVRRLGTLPAPAIVESISGRKARCLVQVAGAELPVEFPVRVLDAHGLRVGMRFVWWMSEDGSVTADDIGDMPPDCPTAAEETEAQRLYDEFRRTGREARLGAAGGPEGDRSWP